MLPIVREAPIYDAARRVFEAGLGRDDSAFTPGLPIWTEVAAEDLNHRFVEAPDTGKDSFTTKLRGQLAGAPRETVQLAAELLYVYLLAPVPSNMGWAAKRQLLDDTLSLSPEGVTIPVGLLNALKEGFASVGTAYLTLRDRQLRFLVRFLLAWKQLPPELQRRAFADPWEFRDVADSIPIDSAFSQRNALLHLAFPDTFEDIVSRAQKLQIARAFADKITDPTGDVDRDLLHLRSSLEAAEGGPISFYTDDLSQVWQGAPKTLGLTEPAATQLRGWLVRGANVEGHNFVQDWLDHGYCSINYPELPPHSSAWTPTELNASLAEASPELNPRQRALHVGNLDRFLNRMKVGDLVATVDGPNLYVGTVHGYPLQLATPHEPGRSHTRAVNWLPSDPPLERDLLSQDTREKLLGQMTVSELGPAATAEVAHLAGLGKGLQASSPSPPLPSAPKDLADQLFVTYDWLNESIDLLREKKQLIFYGPPGTGKTYLAQGLAVYLTEQTAGEYVLVQFHPSYSYEDFFEGFRPQIGVGEATIAFALEPGPFKLLAREAQANPEHAYVLVIDEINRANLSKVFGELYFLLEYRDRAVTLQYSPADSFRLPDNLYILGTMNTADRSIALVDSAMRRRFNWQGLFPGEPPVDGMLRRWLSANGVPGDRANLLEALNQRIPERDSKIGPSYLMTPYAATEVGLQRIWKHQILPLLEERHTGEGVDIDGLYGLGALRSGGAVPDESAVNTAAIIEETGDPPS